MNPNDRNRDQRATSIRLPRPDPSRLDRNSAKPLRLLDRMREGLRARHCNRRTEKTYVGWTRRFILINGKRHPDETGEAEIGACLSHLASEAKVSASTQNQALAALLFLYLKMGMTSAPSRSCSATAT